MFHSRRLFWIGAALAVWLAGFVPAVGAAESTKLVPVTLQLKWTHQFQFAGYYAAVEKGYYREAGLEVNLVAAKPGMDSVKEVLAGRAQFGVGTSELLLLRSRGEPVVMLATVFQHSPQVLLTKQTALISDLQALHDQKIMLEPQSAELLAYFKYEGLDPEKLSIVPHTFRVTELLADEVAAISAYGTDEPFQMQAAGVDYQVFMPRAGGIDFYGDNLFTTEEMIKLHPDRVRQFRKASLRGWEYALKHPEEIIDLILRDYDTPKNRAHLEFEAEHTIPLMHPGLIEVGHTNPGRWRYMADTYAEFGMMPRNYDLTGFIYDPDPQPDYTWAYWTMGILGATALAGLGWALPLWRLNRRLEAAKEAAEEADRAKGRYLAFMTHELRSPISGIVGVIYELSNGWLSSKQRELIELVDHAAQNQLRLIDGVLDYAKMESNSLRLERVPLDLNEFVTREGSLFRAVARTKGIDLICEIAPEVPAKVVTDPTRLRQIVANLLSNAVKFTSQGEVRLNVSVDHEDRTNNTVSLRFAVSDTGIGIPPEAQSRLFQLYEQGSPAINRQHGGTGLGLAITKRLVDIMKGSISIQSSPGQGSQFVVLLPVDKTG